MFRQIEQTNELLRELLKEMKKMSTALDDILATEKDESAKTSQLITLAASQLKAAQDALAIAEANSDNPAQLAAIKAAQAETEATLNAALGTPGSSPSVSLAGQPSGNVGVSYTGAFSPTGSQYSVLSGSLPPGLSLSVSGTISGTPTQAGTFAGTVGEPASPPQSFTIVINP